MQRGEVRPSARPGPCCRLGDELDVEKWRACGTSMNIGIMLFPGGARAGSLRAMSEATEHLSIDNNLKRVDQGPMNYRWKYGYRDFKWPRPLFAERDPSGRRLSARRYDNQHGRIRSTRD